MNNCCLILVCGAPGAGKSTFSKPIVNEFGCTWLDIDCVGDPFSLERDQEYSEHIEPKAIQVLLNLAALNLSAKQSVLLDLPWKHLFIKNPTLITKIQELASNANVPLIVFDCYLSETELRRRIIQRNAYRDLPKIQSDVSWQEFLTQIHFNDSNPLEHISINTEQRPAVNFDIAKKHILERSKSVEISFN